MAWLQIIEFIKFTQEGGSIAQWLAYLLPDPAALGSITQKNFREQKQCL